MNTTTLERSTKLTHRSLKDLRGYRLLATDGEIGKVDDFYFDDASWTLRYFVVTTGGWLDRRKRLISPSALTDSDATARTIRTRLTRKQIERAPEADLAKPVSRQFEIKLHEHYAWPMYWNQAPTVVPSEGGDPHLRSASEVMNYRIQAQDGKIGHVEDLIVEERSWIVRYMAIDTRNWLPGRKVLISPSWVDSVSWANGQVKIDMTRDQVKDSPKYDPAQPVNRTYEERLYDFYGRPRYWF